MTGDPRHNEIRELLGAYAVNALEPPERAAVEGHLSSCAHCRDEVAAHQETLQALTLSAPAPDHVWDRVEAKIQSERQSPATADAEPGNATVTSIGRARAPRWLGASLGVAAAVAAAVALTLVVSKDDGPGTPTVQASVVPTSSESALSGQVRLFAPSTPAGRIILDLSDIPPSPAGHHYQVWVLRTDAAGAMEAVGAFSPEANDAQIELRLPGPGEYAAVDISVQEDGGPPEHSGVSIAGASLR